MDDMEIIRPLERGEVIVWTLKKYGATSGLSEAHRYLDASKTFCQETVPPLSRLVPTELLAVDECRRCAVLYQNGATVADAMRSLLDEVRQRGAA